MNTLINIKRFLLAIAFIPALISCQSDDDKPSTSNTITLDGQPFKIQSASLLGVSMDGEGHVGITFVNTDGTLTKSLGIDFEYTANQSVSGTYSFPRAGTDKYLDDWLTNYTVMNQSSSGMTSESTHLSEGTLTVKDNGDSHYTVTIDLTMEDGKVFKGTYQGKMQAMFNNS